MSLKTSPDSLLPEKTSFQVSGEKCKRALEPQGNRISYERNSFATRARPRAGQRSRRRSMPPAPDGLNV